MGRGWNGVALGCSMVTLGVLLSIASFLALSRFFGGFVVFIGLAVGGGITIIHGLLTLPSTGGRTDRFCWACGNQLRATQMTCPNCGSGQPPLKP